MKEDQNFNFAFEYRHQLTMKDIDNRIYQYDDEFDSYTHAFHDIASSFRERGIYFVLQIQNVVIPTHVAELSIFLESFYDFVMFLREDSSKAFTLDFYEQGATYFLHFEKADDDFYVLDFDDKRVDKVKLDKFQGGLLSLNLTLFAFYSEFIFLVKAICPSIAQSKIYKEWHSTIQGKLLLNR